MESERKHQSLLLSTLLVNGKEMVLATNTTFLPTRQIGGEEDGVLGADSTAKNSSKLYKKHPSGSHIKNIFLKTNSLSSLTITRLPSTVVTRKLVLFGKGKEGKKRRTVGEMLLSESVDLMGLWKTSRAVETNCTLFRLSTIWPNSCSIWSIDPEICEIEKK